LSHPNCHTTRNSLSFPEIKKAQKIIIIT
jgi:hypothetical protein